MLNYIIFEAEKIKKIQEKSNEFWRIQQPRILDIFFI